MVPGTALHCTVTDWLVELPGNLKPHFASVWGREVYYGCYALCYSEALLSGPCACPSGGLSSLLVGFAFAVPDICVQKATLGLLVRFSNTLQAVVHPAWTSWLAGCPWVQGFLPPGFSNGHRLPW